MSEKIEIVNNDNIQTQNSKNLINSDINAYENKNDTEKSKNENKGKMSIDMIVPTRTLNMLKNFQNNIYIEMENKYGCSITKRVEVQFLFYFVQKLANNEDLNILTFTGEPDKNSYALFYLMRHISDIENK